MSQPRDPSVKSALLRSCPKACFICGYCKQDSSGAVLVQGAHIKDNAKNTANDRPENMILLCPNHHVEYDRGIIDFDTEGIIHTLRPDDPENGKTMAFYPKYVPPGIVEYHNKQKFKGNIRFYAHAE